MTKVRKLLRNTLKESEANFWADIYKSGQAHWTDKNVSGLAELAIEKYAPFQSVLEIGCGAGIDTFLLAQHATKVIGMDISADAIKLANTNYAERIKKGENRANITFIAGDFEMYRFDERFDFIYTLSVLHSTKIGLTLPKVASLLSENGHAIIYMFVDEKEAVSSALAEVVMRSIHTIHIDKREFVTVGKDSGGDTHKAVIYYIRKLGA